MRRLPAICSLITQCDTFADIGCDHGFISQFVLTNNLAKTVIAADISEKCLKKARILLSDYSNVQFVCTDGLTGIEADIVAIGGLGGRVITSILEQSNIKPQLILQPQDHRDEVRKHLTRNNYKIVEDFVVEENGKYYDVMKATVGEQALDEFQLELGAFYLDFSEKMSQSRQVLAERIKKEYHKYCNYSDGGKNDDKRAFLKEALIRLKINY